MTAVLGKENLVTTLQLEPVPVPAAPPELPCRRHDPDMWFAESPATLETAKALCGSCPVRELCLAGALHRREPWGVWGGQLVVNGEIIARKRPRGRPRKHPRPGTYRNPAASG